MPLNDADEKTLILSAQEGDLNAFDQLILRHQDGVYNLALRLMKNPEDALDLSQDVFCTCFRKLNSFKGDSSLYTWLYRITINTAKNIWKKRSRRPHGHSVSIDEKRNPGEDERPVTELADMGAGPEKIASGREIMEALKIKLNELPHEQAEALTLRFNHQMSYDEIAGVLECSVGTVKSRIHRARAELRKLMEPYL